MRPTNRSIPAIVAVAVVIGVAMRPDAAVTAAYPLKADFSDAEDDSVLFGSVVPLMTNRFAGAGSRNRVRFETDTCGTLERCRMSCFIACRNIGQMSPARNTVCRLGLR